MDEKWQIKPLSLLRFILKITIERIHGYFLEQSFYFLCFKIKHFLHEYSSNHKGGVGDGKKVKIELLALYPIVLLHLEVIVMNSLVNIFSGLLVCIK